MAYEVWEKAGRPHGRDREFWFEAERQLQAAMKKAAAPAPPAKPVLAVAKPRENTVPPVARIEPARVQSAPSKPVRTMSRKLSGTPGNGKNRV